MGMKFNMNNFETLLKKTVENGLSDMLSKQLPSTLLDGLIKSGTVVKYDGEIASLSGGDPALEAEAMAIWKSKKE